jgi:SAM-dependent methyltransferase
MRTVGDNGSTVNTNPYDTVPYPTWPRLETHPDRLAAVAILHGLTPAPVDACRLLEIGCGSGGNLVSMAHTLPTSEFTGIELARAPAAAARDAARALGLRNFRILREDFRKASRTLGRFDYIVAHGVYSWIPAEARDALLALCRKRLAPGGVAMLSYNVYPGRHLRHMLRGMMLYHTGGAADPEQARALLTVLRREAVLTGAWRALLEEEIDEALRREPASLVHDDLAAVNHPVWFHEFAAQAARHGLRYLGDAHLQESLDVRGALAGVRDRIAREQYLDFLKLRRFRQTLLCRGDEKPSAAPQLRRISRLAFSSPARAEGEFLTGATGVKIRRGDPLVEAIAATLAAAWPRPVPFAALRRHPGAREVLFSLSAGGFVEPHAWHFPCAAAPAERPAVSALARYQLRSGRFVTTLCHRTVELDDRTALLASLADGTRDRAALAREWGKDAAKALDWLAAMALLEA